MHRKSPAGLVLGDDFKFGAVNLGILLGYSDRSYGFGLFLAVDTEPPDPGIHLVLGPLAFAARWGGDLPFWEVRFLRWHIVGGCA